MAKVTVEEIAYCVAALAIALIMAWKLHEFPRTHGENITYQLVFWGIALFCAIAPPEAVQRDIFSKFGASMVGTVYPVFESIRAISSPGVDDDARWVEYWITESFFVYTTMWVERSFPANSKILEMFYEFQFFFFMWLFLPFTDGAFLIFKHITKPFLVPLVKPWAENMSNWLNVLVTTMINAMHLWVLWALFVFLPKDLKSFVAVSVGIIYPFICSVVAAGTDDEEGYTFWLTYWSCYGVLFLAMDWTQDYIGWIPGFYTFVILASVYLMLPMFEGAKKVYREILVPLTGQQENLILRDALKLNEEILKKVPEDRRTKVQAMLADTFSTKLDTKSSESESRNAKSSEGFGTKVQAMLATKFSRKSGTTPSESERLDAKFSEGYGSVTQNETV